MSVSSQSGPRGTVRRLSAAGPVDISPERRIISDRCPRDPCVEGAGARKPPARAREGSALAGATVAFPAGERRERPGLSLAERRRRPRSAVPRPRAGPASAARGPALRPRGNPGAPATQASAKVPATRRCRRNRASHPGGARRRAARGPIRRSNRGPAPHHNDCSPSPHAQAPPRRGAPRPPPRPPQSRTCAPGRTPSSPAPRPPSRRSSSRPSGTTETWPPPCSCR